MRGKVMKVIVRNETKHQIGSSARVWKVPKYPSLQRAPKGAEILGNLEKHTLQEQCSMLAHPTLLPSQPGNPHIHAPL